MTIPLVKETSISQGGLKPQHEGKNEENGNNPSWRTSHPVYQVWVAPHESPIADISDVNGYNQENKSQW